MYKSLQVQQTVFKCNIMPLPDKAMCINSSSQVVTDVSI